MPARRRSRRSFRQNVQDWYQHHHDGADNVPAGIHLLCALAVLGALGHQVGEEEPVGVVTLAHGEVKEDHPRKGEQPQHSHHGAESLHEDGNCREYRTNEQYHDNSPVTFLELHGSLLG